jgi:predicted RNA binding protein YcfA (HicA-like mRNA interferase family)
LNLPRGVSARDFVRALEADGFVNVRTVGSHRHFKHSDGRRVTVSAHKDSDSFPIGTLRSMILRQARWTEDDLRRLHLIK